MAASKALLNIDVSADLGREVNLVWLCPLLRAAMDQLAGLTDRAIARVSVLIVNDAHMASLNRAHRDFARTTDVLTFDLSPDASAPIEADIAVCADEAARRALEFSHSLERELLLYVIHGMLHCLGFDDENEDLAAVMHTEEDRILQAIGVGTTFHRQ